MCRHNAFVTLCHRHWFNCNPFICVASFISIVMLRSLKQFIGDIFILGGGGGGFKGPTLGPLGKHKCQGPVQLWGPPFERCMQGHQIKASQ